MAAVIGLGMVLKPFTLVLLIVSHEIMLPSLPQVKMMPAKAKITIEKVRKSSWMDANTWSTR